MLLFEILWRTDFLSLTREFHPIQRNQKSISCFVDIRGRICWSDILGRGSGIPDKYHPYNRINLFDMSLKFLSRRIFWPFGVLQNNWFGKVQEYS